MIFCDRVLYVMKKVASFVAVAAFLFAQTGSICPCAYAAENFSASRATLQSKAACHEDASSEKTPDTCCKGKACDLHAVSDRELPQFNLAFSDVFSFRPSPAAPDFSLLTLSQTEASLSSPRRDRFHRASSAIASLAQPLFISLETLRL